ncbi:MAG: SDR family NAD(P)-dependent oxidoreductase, partial [Thermomicrobiales bacterium]
MGMLDGKAVIITGASRGIGKAIADLYANEGARVVCVARTLNEGDHMLEGSLQTTVSGIHERGGDAIAVQA